LLQAAINMAPNIKIDLWMVGEVITLTH